MFRVMDDIKEIVRNFGDKLCRVVSFFIIRVCDVFFIDKFEVS